MLQVAALAYGRLALRAPMHRKSLSRQQTRSACAARARHAVSRPAQRQYRVCGEGESDWPIAWAEDAGAREQLRG